MATESARLRHEQEIAEGEAKRLRARAQEMEGMASAAARLSASTSRVVGGSATGVEAHLQGSIDRFSSGLREAAKRTHEAAGHAEALARKLGEKAEAAATAEREAAENRRGS